MLPMALMPPIGLTFEVEATAGVVLPMAFREALGPLLSFLPESYFFRLSRSTRPPNSAGAGLLLLSGSRTSFLSGVSMGRSPGISPKGSSGADCCCCLEGEGTPKSVAKPKF